MSAHLDYGHLYGVWEGKVQCHVLEVPPSPPSSSSSSSLDSNLSETTPLLHLHPASPPDSHHQFPTPPKSTLSTRQKQDGKRIWKWNGKAKNGKKVHWADDLDLDLGHGADDDVDVEGQQGAGEEVVSLVDRRRKRDGGCCLEYWFLVVSIVGWVALAGWWGVCGGRW